MNAWKILVLGVLIVTKNIDLNTHERAAQCYLAIFSGSTGLWITTSRSSPGGKSSP